MIKKILIVQILMLGFIQCSTACDCMVSSLEETIPRTEVIVRGTFIKVQKSTFPLFGNQTEKDRLFYEGSIIVNEVLKGSNIHVGDTIKVVSDYSDCAIRYKNNTAYLFFASWNNSGIESNACSFTTEINKLDESERYKKTKEFLDNG